MTSGAANKDGSADDEELVVEPNLMHGRRNGVVDVCFERPSTSSVVKEIARYTHS